jgi:hypothetical protein
MTSISEIGRRRFDFFRFHNVEIGNNIVVLHYETEVYITRRKRASRPVWCLNTRIEIPLIWKMDGISMTPSIDKSQIWFSYIRLPGNQWGGLQPFRQQYAGISQLPITKKLLLPMAIFKE